MKKILLFLGIFVLIGGFARADLQLNNIYFDPAIVASGDRVDIVVEFEETGSSSYRERFANSDYSFAVELDADNDLATQYVTLEDTQGDDLRGTIFAAGHYNKKFTVKINENAPPGNYEFLLRGKWYYQDSPLDGSEYIRFTLPVKKEGIVLDIATLTTEPALVRAGDKYIKLHATIENTGEKDAKAVQVTLTPSPGISASYSDNNRNWVGRLNSHEQKEVTFFIDVDDEIEAGIYDIAYTFTFSDDSNNNYVSSKKIPFKVKGKPNLQIVDITGSARAAQSSTLTLKIKNVGQESAESVDVRLLKENSQPFTFDVRSDYVGELKPQEEGIAVFNIGVLPDATIKDHSFKVLIRAKGNSDEGDDNIYIYHRRANFTVTGKAINWHLILGAIAFVLVLSWFVYNRRKKHASRKHH